MANGRTVLQRSDVLRHHDNDDVGDPLRLFAMESLPIMGVPSNRGQAVLLKDIDTDGARFGYGIADPGTSTQLCWKATERDKPFYGAT